MLILLFLVNISFSQSVDTLRVYQNDTLTFKSTLSENRITCWHVDPFNRIPRFSIHYEIINPMDSSYYLIYNEERQLVKEGLFTSRYIEGETYGDFYNCRFYDYDNKGRLVRIYYREDGDNDRAEHYKRGKLRETKVYH